MSGIRIDIMDWLSFNKNLNRKKDFLVRNIGMVYLLKASIYTTQIHEEKRPSPRAVQKDRKLQIRKQKGVIDVPEFQWVTDPKNVI